MISGICCAIAASNGARSWRSSRREASICARAEVGVDRRAAQAREVLGGGEGAALGQAGGEPQAEVGDALGRRAEGAVGDHRVGRGGDVEHRRQVDVDPEAGEEGAGRLALELGVAAVAVEGELSGRALGRGREEALDAATLLVGGDHQRRLAARGGGRLQALDARAHPIGVVAHVREDDHPGDLAGAGSAQQPGVGAGVGADDDPLARPCCEPPRGRIRRTGTESRRRRSPPSRPRPGSRRGADDGGERGDGAEGAQAPPADLLSSARLRAPQLAASPS